MRILLTGGTGYVGSHVSISLIQANYDIVLLDNFSNSDSSVLGRLNRILGKPVTLIKGDVRDTSLVKKTLQDYQIETVIHFAGLKSVGESSSHPIEYYANNVQGTISLLEAMKLAEIKNLIFSSSATVYGNPEYLPIDEDHPTSATNAYGRSKLHIEEMLRDVASSDPDWRIICLRYFNPVGAHESGLIGENPNGVPNNLMPYIAQVAIGKLPYLRVYGEDYLTSDGTGVRDYIHIMDLAEGHLAALTYINKLHGLEVFNLGTGSGVSVKDVISAYQRASGRIIEYRVEGRRLGDIPSCFTLVNKSSHILHWRAKRNLDDMCKSSWLWQKNLQSISN